MNQLLAYAVGVMAFCAIYLLLSARFWKVIIGTVFLSHAVHMILLSTGGFDGTNSPPLVNWEAPYMDPLPQALILTAIVISFGVTALILVILRQLNELTGTTNLKQVEQTEWGNEDHD